MKEHKELCILETGVKGDPAFCLGPPIEKNSAVRNCFGQTFQINQLNFNKSRPVFDKILPVS